MTFSSGSFGCTGGGGATNSNLWDSMAFGFIETYDVFQGYYVNDTSDAALWQDVAMGGGEMNYLFSFSVSEGINGFGGYAVGWDGGGYTPQKPTSKPCPPSGNAPSPSSYQAEAQTAQLLNNGVNASGSFINAVNLLSFHRGGSLDAQAYGASTAYGNYAFGVYTSAYGYSLSFTLSAANAYGALFSTYNWSPTLQPDSTYTHIPAANVSNITQGYNDQRNGSLCNPQ
jgi:hypothetical protein